MKIKAVLAVFIILTSISLLFGEEINKDTGGTKFDYEWLLIPASFGVGIILDQVPAWPHRPLLSGRTTRSYKKDLIRSEYLYGGIGLFTLGLIFLPNNSGWMNTAAYLNTKGFLEACSFTFLTTSLIKNIVGRRRPSYSYYSENEDIDGQKSFPSGHASISFAVAVYTSLFAFEHVGDNSNPFHLAGKIFFSGSMLALATYVAYTRYMDHKHFLSDLIVGGCLGALVSTVVYIQQNRWFRGTSPGAQSGDASTINFDVFIADGRYGMNVSMRF